MHTKSRSRWERPNVNNWYCKASHDRMGRRRRLAGIKEGIVKAPSTRTQTFRRTPHWRSAREAIGVLRLAAGPPSRTDWWMSWFVASQAEFWPSLPPRGAGTREEWERHHQTRVARPHWDVVVDLPKEMLPSHRHRRPPPPWSGMPWPWVEGRDVSRRGEREREVGRKKKPMWQLACESGWRGWPFGNVVVPW